MAQEPSSKDLLEAVKLTEAVKQQESGGRRYKADGKTLLEGPQTKYGTAKGEMQVLDMTNKDPGYGVKPAQDDSPDERARVGRDYLNAMVKKYGNRETALVAYNWGPGNTDKWLDKGGDFSKLPKETQNYVTKITGALGSTKLAQATPTQKSKAGVQRVGYKAASVGSPLLSQLGPSYQAAMAVSMLADEAEKEGKDENEPSEAEKMLAAMPSKPAPVVDLDLGYQSPFPEIQAQAAPVARKPLPLLRPVRMAEGGDVNYFQDPFGVPDSGPVTADTLSKGKEFKAAEALQVLKDVGTGAARNLKNILQGVTETPYNLVGGAADIGNLVLTPIGLGSKEPTGGSAQLKRLATEAGIRPAPPTDPRDAGFYMMGELGASVVNPADVVRKGVQATQTTTAGVKKAADLLRDMKKPKQVPQTAPAPALPPVPTPALPPVPTPAPNVAARQAEPLPAPPAEVAVPPEMLEMPPVASPMQAGMPVERPFVGRLDAFIDTIKNPVQLGQLKGQLKGKFRDYDLERVERAFPGIDDKTKLTPDQIKQALAGVHSPQKWISETVQPKAGAHHQNTDNVWGAPLGTTNLYLEQAPEVLEANTRLRKALQVFGPFMQKSSSIPTPEALAQARALLSEPDILKIVDPELISNLSKSFDKVEKNVGLVKEYSGVIRNVSDGLQYPVLYKDATVASAKYSNQPFFKFREEAMAAEREVLKQKFMAQGKNEQDASFLASGEINANFDLHNKNAEKIASFRVQELAIAEGQKQGIFVNLPDVSLVKWDELNDVTRPMQGNTAFKESVENALEPARVTLHEATKNIKRVMDPEIKNVGDILYQRGNLYEGKHKSVAGKPYPIGFTRFSEHETTLPDKGTLQGRHFHELQSDLSKDMRKSGTTSGNASKDQAEYNKLQNEVQQSKQKAMDKLQVLQQEKRDKIKAGTLPNTRLKEIETEEEAIRKSLDTGIRAMEKRISILGGRVRDKASYSLQEPFAGFETNQMVRQQLLMKNAIQSAMRDGKGFATFPGAESNNPNLYVGKVELNLKQVIKDLGGKESGVELRLIELPPDKDGRPITATGVVWSPEAAARIAEKGIPFAKGGMVERQSADTRRYL